MNQTMTRVVGVWITGVCVVAVATTACADGGNGPSPLPGPDQTVLRLARSNDGLRFEDTGEALAVGAASPDLTVLPNGDLLLLFDRAGGPAVARSRDEGRNWSSARRVSIHGGGRKLRAQHGDLVPVPGGYFRLFFAATTNGPGASSASNVICSAVTRDGINYRLDRSLHLPLPKGDDLHPVAGWIGDRLHVLVGSVGRDFVTGHGVYRVISRDGMRFARLVPFPVDDVTFAGSMVPTDAGARVFVSAKEGMRVLESVEGRSWRVRGDARLPLGWDPAVVEVDRGQYLMVYCAPRSEETLASSQLITIESGASDWSDVTDGDAWEDTEAPVVDPDSGQAVDMDGPAAEVGVDEPVVVDTELVDDEGEVVLGADDADVVVAGAADGTEPPDLVLMEDFDAGGGTFAGYDLGLMDGYAPRPDFVTKVKYIEWYTKYALGDPDDNAWYAYAEFMPLPDDEPGAKPELPVFNDMFNSDSFGGPPAPWNPAEHPEWARNHAQVSDLIEKYKQASKHENYAQPLYRASDADFDEAQRDLLIWITLPTLSTHRTMAKAILADAWREENGKVSPTRMLEAFETTLRASNHLHQGATLIEDLVGEAMSNLTRENARWALKQDVFAADELETVLDTLQRYEVDMEDPVNAMRGEHAFSMDLTQHLFTPPTQDGEPHFNRARAVRTFSVWNDEARSEDLLARTSQMTPADVQETLDTMERHYQEMGELMRIGYPEVRAADITAIEQRSYGTNALVDAMMPSFARYHQLRARGRASRRATQLAYATELFKRRTGRYPSSLAELPNDRGETMKIDPFTGDYFGYRLTDDGPRIYSLSEDGIDSGGNHSPQWDRDNGNEEGSDDYVFWPPQPR